MPPGVHRNKEPVLHLSAAPALETPPPLTPTTIHEQFRALLAGRGCLVDTPFEKELEPHWSAQTTSMEFAVEAFEETFVLASRFYILSEKRRIQERRIAWRALERAHAYGNPTVPAHGILCGHETLLLSARRPLSTVAIPLLRSAARLETTPDNTFTTGLVTLSVRRGNTMQPLSDACEDSDVKYKQVHRLLGQLAEKQAVRYEPTEDLPHPTAVEPPLPPLRMLPARMHLEGLLPKAA